MDRIYNYYNKPELKTNFSLDQCTIDDLYFNSNNHLIIKKIMFIYLIKNLLSQNNFDLFKKKN